MTDIPTPGFLSQADYARHRGCSRQNIWNLIQDGRIAVSGDGLIDVAAADASLPESPGLSTGAEVEPDADGSSMTALSHAQLRKTEAEATMAEMKLAERAGELIERSEVAQVVSEISAAFREQLSGLPSRVADKIVIARTPREVSVVLAEALEGDLTRLADQLEKMAAGFLSDGAPVVFPHGAPSPHDQESAHQV